MVAVTALAHCGTHQKWRRYCWRAVRIGVVSARRAPPNFCNLAHVPWLAHMPNGRAGGTTHESVTRSISTGISIIHRCGSTEISRWHGTHGGRLCQHLKNMKCVCALLTFPSCLMRLCSHVTSFRNENHWMKKILLHNTVESVFSCPNNLC